MEPLRVHCPHAGGHGSLHYCRYANSPHQLFCAQRVSSLTVVAVCVLVLSGGLAAVIYTDTLQTFIMIIGAITLTIFGMYRQTWTRVCTFIDGQ